MRTVKFSDDHKNNFCRTLNSVRYINPLSNKESMRWFVLVLAFAFLFFVGCANQASVNSIQPQSGASELDQCYGEVEDLNSYNEELIARINLLEDENYNINEQLEKSSSTKVVGDVDLLDWTTEEMMRGLIRYEPKFREGGWWTYFYDLDNENYYYQEAEIFPKDPFFRLRYKNSGQEFNVSKLRIINIALGNRTLGEASWGSYVSKVLRETQADPVLTCYQQTACRQVHVVKCSKSNQTMAAWSEGTNLFMSRNDGSLALDAFERFYCA